MKVMVARFVILLVSSILNRSPTSDYVNSISAISCFELFKLLLSTFSVSIESLSRYDSRAFRGGSYTNLRPSVESYEQSRSSGYSGENDL